MVSEEFPAFPSQEPHTKISTWLKAAWQLTMPWRAREEVSWEEIRHRGNEFWGFPTPPWAGACLALQLPPKLTWGWLLSPLQPCFLQIAQPSLHHHSLAAGHGVKPRACRAREPKVVYALWSWVVAGTGKRWLWDSDSLVPRILAGISLNCQCIQQLFLPLVAVKGPKSAWKSDLNWFPGGAEH